MHKVSPVRPVTVRTVSDSHFTFSPHSMTKSKALQAQRKMSTSIKTFWNFLTD